MKIEKTDVTNTDIINFFSVGMTESYSQTITDYDIKSFSGISEIGRAHV